MRRTRVQKRLRPGPYWDALCEKRNNEERKKKLEKEKKARNERNERDWVGKGWCDLRKVASRC